MDPLLLASPHCDDVILSCGQLLAGRPDCRVVTVFAGCPDPDSILTDYDRACGFSSAGHAMETRWAEDIDAVEGLRGTTVHLAELDNQYREVGCGQGYVDVAAVAADLARIVDADPLITVVLGPLGLAHPDHLITADAFHALLDMRPALEAWLYEDMPARVLWPEEVAWRLDWWRVRGYQPTLDFLGTGSVHAKAAAVACYRSQVGQLEQVCGPGLHPVLCPERHHRLVRT